MWSKNQTCVGIICGDMHLSKTPPVLRSNENDWMLATKKVLDEIKGIQKQAFETGVKNCPVFCCGDIFHNWKCDNELITFALDNLPQPFYAIPGQHDLPNHNFNLIQKSAYYTLVTAGKINHLLFGFNKHNFKIEVPYDKIGVVDLLVQGCPYPQKCTNGPTATRAAYGHTKVYMALCHSYLWIGDLNSIRLPIETDDTNVINVYGKRASQWDFIFHGDNHRPWKQGNIVNCGCMYRRSKTELEYKPSVWLLLFNKRTGHTVCKRHYLQTASDVYCDTGADTDNTTPKPNLENTVGMLQQLKADAWDFESAVVQYIKDNGITKDIEKLIKQAMGD